MQSLVEFFCSAYDSAQEKSTVMYNVEFDLGGRMIGINTQVFCLDMERLYDGVYFTVIQALHDLSTCPVDTLGPYLPLKQLRKELFLSETDRESGNQSIPFFTSEISSSADPVANLHKLTTILSAMVSLGLGETFTKSVWAVFGAVYHLGHVVGTVTNALLNGNKSSSKQIEWGQQHFKSACSLLGLSLDNVEKTLVMDEHDTSRVRNVLGFSLGLYAEAVNSLFTTVNKSNSVGFRNIQCLSVSLVQIGGSITDNGA
ncbi:Unconventional myosin-XVIIIa, partial [Orchesella cincta]